MARDFVTEPSPSAEPKVSAPIGASVSRAGPLKVLDLFSGVGGFSLGLEWTDGFKTVAFCEIEPFPRRVLAKHWPGVPCYDDVRTLTADRLRADGIAVDVICGGFPCQDISTAGLGAGIVEGTRSGLWSEYARLVGELRPDFVVVENVAALLGRGLSQVTGDLASLGYDAEWEIISASDIGAPHDRERLWVVAYPSTQGRERILRHWAWRRVKARPEWPSATLDTQRGAASWLARTAARISPILGDDDGLPARVAKSRLGCLGNAVVPQIPELIGRAILAACAKDGSGEAGETGTGSTRQGNSLVGKAEAP